MRVTVDDDGERLLISSAGVWQAQDLLATLQGRHAARRGARRCGAALHGAGADDGTECRRALRRIHDGRAGLRDGDGDASLRRRVDARAPGQHAARRAGRSADSATLDARLGERRAPQSAAPRADRSLRHGAGIRRWPCSATEPEPPNIEPRTSNSEPRTSNPERRTPNALPIRPERHRPHRCAEEAGIRIENHRDGNRGDEIRHRFLRAERFEKQP